MIILIKFWIFQFKKMWKVDKNEVGDIGELRANISSLWAALKELQSEVREKFDIHTAIENHEHHVHHLGHEDTDHEIHHSEKHLQHLEHVHGRTAVGPAGIETHKAHTAEEKVFFFFFLEIFKIFKNEMFIEWFFFYN